MLTAKLIAFVFASVSVAAPLDTSQQGRLDALLVWANAYRSCYEPAPYSMKIDRGFTAGCIRTELGRAEQTSSPDEQSALRALMVTTPRLIDVLNDPGKETPYRSARPASPAPPARVAAPQD